jgi:uncharacterized protein YcaQ
VSLVLSAERARRVAVRAQMLDQVAAGDLVGVVERLTFLQLDPISVVAPSADLVLRARLGDGYRPDHLVAALEREHTVFEFRGQDRHNEPVFVMNRPTSQLGLVLGQMLALRDGGGQVNDWLAANAGFRRRVLAALAAGGPMLSRDLDDTAEVPWSSSGWTHDRNVNQMLEFLWSRGWVAVAGRQGRQRLWDLAERVHPPDVVPVPDADRVRDGLRLRSLGIARERVVGSAGVACTVDGVRGRWRVDPELLDESDGGFAGRTVLLSPFDRLVHDRKRAEELFGFDYTLELYRRADRRRFGYYVLPILLGDRLVGKTDLAADRDAGTLDVLAFHDDVGLTAGQRRSVDDELASLATWLGLDSVRVPGAGER